ncbi:MAG: alanine--glyoxylate aminotransferase family protein [Acidobacteria bacterium]|nr:alanine--glyoxylate aminotransferase family protein [Acidobacteriota bacterium]
MATLPSTERLLLGPGPSPAAPRVLRAMAAPVLGHLDPDLLAIMDETRGQLQRLFRAPQGSLCLAVSGTGSSGLEAGVANLVQEGTRVLAVVTGYFGDRLAQVCARYGGFVRRLDVEWGRACDPQAVREALARERADIVCVVHAETSTGVRNPVGDVAKVAHQAGAIVLVDAVTSLGAHPLEVGAWGLDAVYSCTQKGIGAPPGLAPVAFTPSALQHRVACRSFYFDLALLEDYWLRRKYHHTISAPLVYALREALAAIDEEGLEARWQRHERHHLALAAGLEAMGLGLLPPAAERLWTLNAVRVPDGVDEARARRELLERFNMEIGSGLGPLAGKIWRVGLMGNGSTPQMVLLFLGALEAVLGSQGYRVPAGAGTAAAIGALS